MRACVFVDGENLRHTICELFEPAFNRADYLPKMADWGGLYDTIVQQATNREGRRLRTYWYAVQHVDPYPRPQAKRKRGADDLETWARRNTKVLTESKIDLTGLSPAARSARLLGMQEDLTTKMHAIRGRFDGYITIHDGISRKHRAIEFRRSGTISYNLFNGRFGQEKTVDVNLAVDMVTLSQNYDLAVIVSGDQDYVPAAQAVKNLGKPVVNVAFKARNGLLLPGGAVRLNQMTDWSVEMGWDEIRQHLKITVPASTAEVSVAAKAGEEDDEE